ncbi:conjugal transfer protein TrbA [Clostridium baratii]|uniref:HTH cro/C1-type domain-containing protein n=1 Tax=Clostridium nitritogenes TaxID=83340 RepID=A0ABP3WUL5_9CLOT|nr:helix-turn-helix transcriptional regulator [Clostridium baratii]CUO90899.1 conjugal transfer protein TrbA [Clostridium baratii]
MNAEDKFRQAMIRERINHEMTQTCLAKKIKKSPSFLCDIEASRKNPSISTMVDIAKILNISLDNIFLK